jgi:hypothetical protein
VLAKFLHKFHHKLWTTNLDPTHCGANHRFYKWYTGLVDIPSITAALPHTIVENDDSFLNICNQHYYKIKLLLSIIFIIIFGWSSYIHYVVVQQFLVYLGLKIHDIIFHKKLNSNNDNKWLFFIFDQEAFHIDHHLRVKKIINWKFRYVSAQYFWARLLMKI